MRGHIITFERANKGDLDITIDAAGYMARASQKDNSILNTLHDKRILDIKHIEAAATYSMWQHAFQKPFYAEPRKAYMIEIAGGRGNGDGDEAKYRKLLRRLTRLDQHMIETAILLDWAENIRPLHRQYQIAFDVLCTSIQKVLDDMEQIALS